MEKTKKPVKINNYPFDGFDFTELADAWNVCAFDKDQISDNVEDWRHSIDSDSIKFYLRNVLKGYDGGDPSFVMRKTAKDIRIFATELADCDFHHHGPLWKGLASIEDDFTVISMTIPLVAYMWN